MQICYNDSETCIRRGHKKYLSIQQKFTITAVAAGLSRYTASENSLSPESCLDDQSKRSLRPSAPSLVSVSAEVI